MAERHVDVTCLSSSVETRSRVATVFDPITSPRSFGRTPASATLSCL
jgi:hypothetical protein